MGGALSVKIIDWAWEKGIINHSTPMKQALKTLEEVGELIEAIHHKDPEEIADAIGDIFVTILIQAEMNQLDFNACVQNAYTVISKRTGRMVNGFWVKD